MSDTNNKSGLFVGRNRGRIQKLPAKQAWKNRPVGRKGVVSKRAAFVRTVIRDVAGYSPLEKRLMELIKTQVAAKEKKSVKILRKVIGTHKRALLKKEVLDNAIANQKKAQKGEASLTVDVLLVA